MIPVYFPTLKAKKGEFEALAHLASKTSGQFLPLFELCPLGDTQLSAKKRRFAAAPQLDNINEIAEKLKGLRSGSFVALDINAWAPNATLENGQHVLPYACARVSSVGIQVCPVIGFDRWDDPEYQAGLKQIRLSKDCYFILRLDRLSFEDVRDQVYLKEQVDSIFATLNLTSSNCALAIDLGDVTGDAVVDLIAEVEDLLHCFEPWAFKYVITLGSSIPSSIDQAVSEPDSEDKVIRKEFLTWKALREANPARVIVLGDYAVRNPHSSDAPAPHANGKIRYTAQNHYFVARGHSKQFGNKGAQYFDLAAVIKASPYYRGPDYSWGDFRVASCSAGDFMGNSTDWISIDTNHHITAVIEEVLLFEALLRAKASKEAETRR